MAIHTLAFAAHPDDLEFATGAVLAKEVREGRPVHMIICSQGEAATNGTPVVRRSEASEAARILGTSFEFITLDGDAHLDAKTQHALTLARLIRRHQPTLLLAPSLHPNQHPDHARLGALVRDAARLARYGGLAELKDLAPHAIHSLFYYALSPDAEPPDLSPLLIDISDPALLAAWTAAMNAHASQLKTRNYVDLQLTRARLNGLRCGGTTTHALPLFPADPLLFDSLAPLGRSARSF